MRIVCDRLHALLVSGIPDIFGRNHLAALGENVGENVVQITERNRESSGPGIFIDGLLSVEDLAGRERRCLFLVRSMTPRRVSRWPL